MRSIRFNWFSAFLLVIAVSMPSLAVDLQVLPGHVPKAIATLQPLGRMSPLKQLDLAIGLHLRNQTALTNLLHEISDPASPNYRNYLTPAEFAEQFGPKAEEYEAIIAFAGSNGLSVRGKHSNRLLLNVSGTAEDIEKAFHVRLLEYSHPTESRTFYAPDVEPSVDSGVPVLHIAGLDNYARPHPANLNRIGAASLGPTEPLPNAGSGPGGSYAGNDFRAAYLPGVSLDGAGQTLGLVEFDGYYTNDIVAYENRSGLPSVILTNVLLDGFGGAPSSNNFEVSLDLELAIAMAPGLSELIVYEGGPQGIADDILNRMATDDLAKQISSSWLWGTGDDPMADQIFQQFAAQGQSFFIAAGDVDAYTSAIPFPADNPIATVVGATTLSTTSNGAWASESVWNFNNGQGSSGGVSPTYSIPVWQQGVSMTTNQGSTTHRNLPDVAMIGNNLSIIYNNGATDAFYGTSCSAPLWAAFIAIANQQAAGFGQGPVGFINPALYAIGGGNTYSACFHDITAGNNFSSTSPTKFSACPGYDLCTGWGSPAGQALINALVPPSYLVITPQSGLMASGLPGGPFTPASQSLYVSNSGSASLSWSVTNPAPWISVTPSNGTLSGGGPAAAITVSFTTAAYNLTNVTSAMLIFTDKNTGLTQTRPFTLQISPSLVQNGGFEAGNFSGWTLNGSVSDNVVSSSYGQITPHSGQDAAVFGQYHTLAYLSQSVSTVPGQAYQLSFWLTNPTGDINTSEVVVNWNTSSNTNTLFSQTNSSAYGWTLKQYIVVATGSNSTIQFGFQDDPAYLGLDDVSLVPVATPTLEATAPPGGPITLSWTATVGLTYQLQYKTNLMQSAWWNLGSSVTATNSSISVTNSFGSDLQRFYRIHGPE